MVTRLEVGPLPTHGEAFDLSARKSDWHFFAAASSGESTKAVTRRISSGMLPFAR